jgi:hypothetical protein
VEETSIKSRIVEMVEDYCGLVDPADHLTADLSFSEDDEFSLG